MTTDEKRDIYVLLCIAGVLSFVQMFKSFLGMTEALDAHQWGTGLLSLAGGVLWGFFVVRVVEAMKRYRA